MRMRLRGFLPAALLALATGVAVGQPAPLVRAHAHNDYAHQRPLLDALDHGFCSVEADVFLVNTQLLVGHTRLDLKPGRTLEALYLDPLQARVKQNGGRVFPAGPEVTLLIDLKTDWRKSYPVLRQILTRYEGMLTTFRAGAKATNAITVIITGDRSQEMFAGEAVRYAALDGGLPDLDSDTSPDLIPWISERWGSSFKWRGQGTMPEAEQRKLDEIVARAHQRGRRVRFWGGPDKLTVWREELNHGVDLINTDDLEGVRKLLTGGS